MSIKTALLAGGIGLLGMGTAEACTAIFFTGTDSTGQEVHMTGRDAGMSFDYLPNPPRPSIAVLQRGLPHNGNTTDGSLVNPAQWTSTYGSIVVDTFGEGVNEKGLSVHLLLQMETVFQPDDATMPSVSCFKVIPYLLDNAATVSECIDLLKQVHVVQDKLSGDIDYFGQAMTYIPVHFAIRDASNDMAMIEYVNAGTKKSPKSEMKVWRGLAYNGMTNEPPYDKQLKNYKKYSKGNKALPGDCASLDRFVRIMMYDRTLTVGSSSWETVTNVFALLTTVWTIPGSIDYSGKEWDVDEHGKKHKGHAWPTVWQSVYDVDNRVFYLKAKKLPGTFWIDLKKIDFSKTGNLPYMQDPSIVGESNSRIIWN